MPVPSPVTVVIADDSSIYREGMVRAITGRDELRLLGEAADGEQALDVVRRLDPDVVVLDVQMPRLDGLEVLRRLLDDDPARRTRAVFISAVSDAGPEISHAFEGHATFLSKARPRREICDAVVRLGRAEDAAAAPARPPLT